MFDYINRVLYKGKEINVENINENKEFQPFLVQRWCSMYSAPLAHIVNETTNRYWKSFEGNSEWFTALDTIIPKCKYKRFNYIKKAKKETVKKSNESLTKVANCLEISSREVSLYIEQFNLKLPNEEKSNT